VGGSLRALQGGLVSLQERGPYCDAIAGATINAMNTSANTNQNCTTTTSTARGTGNGLLRRNIAGALLAMAFASTGIGLAATGHADPGDQTPDTDTTTSAPAPAATLPWWLNGLIDYAFHPHLHCGNRGFEGKFRCDWY